MYPYQHGDEQNRFQQDENENNPLEDPAAAFEQNLVAKLTDFLGCPHNEEQPSGGRHSRPLQDHNNGEQQSGERHSRPLEDPSDREQPSRNKTSESEAEADPLARNGQYKNASEGGKTKGKDETLMYLHNGKWVPAVYHDAVRHYLIENANKNGEYDFPREAGIEPDNVTSFLESQKSWGPVRNENWADILYVFDRKGKNPPKDSPVNWKVGRRVVLAGGDSKPILDYKDIPATLSTELAGRDMEAIKRTDRRIGQRDFIARMPMKYTTKSGRRREIKSSSWIGMEMTRFRQKQGMLSWVGREGSGTIRDALWDRLPKWNKENNTICGLPPPSALEQEQVRAGNVGKFTKNAGVRALTSDEKAKRRLKKEQSKLKKERSKHKKLQVKEGPATGVSRSKRTAPSSRIDDMAGRDGRRGKQAQNSRTEQNRSANERGRRTSPDFADDMTRQDRDPENDEWDPAPPKDGTRQRIIDPRLRQRPREGPQTTRERPSASDDQWMRSAENFTRDNLPQTPLQPSATRDDFEYISPPDFDAYKRRQKLQRKAPQQSYK